MPDNGKHTWMQSLKRMIQYRLFVPIKRSKQPPEHAARGVAVGIFWAMTPFFGAQMALVAMTWLVTTKVFHWNFAILPGVAWTWLTNVITFPAFFYAFYLTGQFVLGQAGSASGFDGFMATFEKAKAAAGDGWMDLFYAWMNVIISDIGLPISIGSIIWSIIGYWVAYYLTLRFVVRYRAAKSKSDADASDGSSNGSTGGAAAA